MSLSRFYLEGRAGFLTCVGKTRFLTWRKHFKNSVSVQRLLVLS